MKRALVIVALTASVFMPVVAFAQPAPSTPSPELRSMMEKIHAEAKMAAYAAIAPAHVASVNSITAKVAAGTLDPRSAGKQIDELLTTDEQNAVLAASQKARENMRAAMEAAGVGPMGGPPGMGGPPPGMHGGPGGPDGAGGPPPGMGGPGMHGGPDGPPGGPEGRHFGRSAGRYLVMVSMTPDQMRNLRPRARSSAAP
jgi:hypothetical protein